MNRRETSSPARAQARNSGDRSEAAILWSAILADRRARDEPGARLRALLLAQIDDTRR
ncbi:hypothetical protein [Methylobacterium dankookense]|uniref:Uncharacterized protein n=1 Tax=Methylobacterium dankookense TaxID=560405 RepID=A0A564G5M4_9HYPH|nr:hypothetical protein [Methylobacterium dankookense]GJD56510.1 hypothetical protein IFDJLNFL_2407 [Methylobacterium dankookense]VUF15306.1 hypothetical protein MTDSW087_05044 [Methylobacterium dankookense]